MSTSYDTDPVVTDGNVAVRRRPSLRKVSCLRRCRNAQAGEAAGVKMPLQFGPFEGSIVRMPYGYMPAVTNYIIVPDGAAGDYGVEVKFSGLLSI